MTMTTKPNPHIVSITETIHHIDVKGVMIQLAAPIILDGQLDLSKLSSEYLPNQEQPLYIGVDEAGRGPLLGCVTVAAAILPHAWSGLIETQPLQGTPLSILTDSKKLSEKKRNILYPLVQQNSVGYLVAHIPAAVIDQVNILQATMLGMRLCSEELLIAIANHLQSTQINTIVGKSASDLQAELLFDGNRFPELDYDRLAALGIESSTIDCEAWVKGDARHTSIAAASILAKVSRDETMHELHTQYPQYGIAKHKGYPTELHMQAIEKFGVLPEHRRSYAPIKKALDSYKLNINKIA